MKTALIIEGSALESAFAVGVMKTLVHHGIQTSYTIGSSIASACSLYYHAQQEDALENIFGEFFKQEDIRLSSIILKGGFNVARVFNQVTEVLPLDMVAFQAGTGTLKLATTRADNGDTVYWQVDQLDSWESLRPYVEASVAMPTMGEPVPLIERSYFDGAITMPLPIEEAIKDGCERFIIIHPHTTGFTMPRKKIGLREGLFYSDYPKLRSAYLMRHLTYNRNLRLIRELVKENKAHILHPVHNSLKRYGIGQSAAAEYFTEGMRITEEALPRLKHLLEEV